MLQLDFPHKLLIIILLAIFNCSSSFAEKTLYLNQIFKLSGPRKVYINDKALFIDNFKQNIQIFFLSSNPNVYYINTKQKKYFIAPANDLPKPRGSGLLIVSFENGDLINQPQNWILHSSSRDSKIYYFKFNPNNTKGRNKISSLVLGNFTNINPICLAVLNKITYAPNLKNIILEIGFFNQSSNLEKFILTNWFKNINYTINLPDLKSYTKVLNIQEIFGYSSADSILKGFSQFCH